MRHVVQYFRRVWIGAFYLRVVIAVDVDDDGVLIVKL